jgi:hypothetical protein
LALSPFVPRETIALFRSLDEEELMRSGVVTGAVMRVRAAVYHTAYIQVEGPSGGPGAQKAAEFSSFEHKDASISWSAPIENPYLWQPIECSRQTVYEAA